MNRFIIYRYLNSIAVHLLLYYFFMYLTHVGHLNPQFIIISTNEKLTPCTLNEQFILFILYIYIQEGWIAREIKVSVK